MILIALDERIHDGIELIAQEDRNDGWRRFIGTKTVIMIAHRLSTVARCDRIVVLDKGRIAGTGDHDELMAGNAVFRAISGR